MSPQQNHTYDVAAQHYICFHYLIYLIDLLFFVHWQQVHNNEHQYWIRLLSLHVYQVLPLH